MNKWLSKKSSKIDDLATFAYKNPGINQHSTEGTHTFEDLLVKVWHYHRGMKFMRSQLQLTAALVFCLEATKHCMFVQTSTLTTSQLHAKLKRPRGVSPI